MPAKKYRLSGEEQAELKGMGLGDGGRRTSKSSLV